MMDRVFYVLPEAVSASGTLSLQPDESRHVARVLRCRKGDQIQVVDGAGNWYRVKLIEVSSACTRGAILEARQDVGEPLYSLTVGMALLKSRARYETFLEKAVELGARTIIPLVTQRTVARGLRTDRARQIMISAMKQCGRCRLPRLQVPRTLEEMRVEGGAGVGLLCDASAPKALSEALAGMPDRVTLLIGPEGGFSRGEVAQARAAGFEPVSLGPARLRAETAAVAAMAVVLQAQAVHSETPEHTGR